MSVSVVAFRRVDYVGMIWYSTVLAQKSALNPYGTLPHRLPDFCPVTVEEPDWMT